MTSRLRFLDDHGEEKGEEVSPVFFSEGLKLSGEGGDVVTHGRSDFT